MTDMIVKVLEAGYTKQLLLSHDRGWYDPAQPGGGTPKPFTHLSDVMLPLLRQRGVEDETIRQLTVSNPFAAYAR